VTLAGPVHSEDEKNRAEAGAQNVQFLKGHIEKIPLPDASVDFVIANHLLEHLENPIAGLREMLRVVKRRAVVLEFVRPPNGPVGTAYRMYLKTLLPAIGGAISGQPSAYRYLSDTVDSYRTPGELRAMAVAAGWMHVEYDGLAMGTVGILSGTKD